MFGDVDGHRAGRAIDKKKTEIEEEPKTVEDFISHQVGRIAKCLV